MAISKSTSATQVTVDAVEDAVEVSVAQSTDVGIQLTATAFTGTITFEGSVDGTNFAAVPAVKSDGTFVSTATAAGVWQADVRGLKKFRARCSAFTSATAAVLSVVRTAESGLV